MLRPFAWARLKFDTACRVLDLYGEHDRGGFRLPVPDLLRAAVLRVLSGTVAATNVRHFPAVPTVNPREGGAM